MVPTVLLVVTVTFILIHIIPGDAVMARIEEGTSLTKAQLTQMRTDLGLERPLVIQYGDWLWRLAHLDAGRSLYTGRPVIDQLRKAIPVTLELMILSQILAVSIAIPIGVTSALKQDTWLDYVLRVFSIGLVAAPGFWLATMAIVFAAYLYHWAPPFGYEPLWKDPVTNLKQFIMPAMVVGLHGTATMMRLTRSAVLEVMRQDYVRTAKAKGLAGRVILSRHVLRNALIPVVTYWGGSVATQLGGTVIIESIFALPGVGLSMIQAIQHNDVTQLQINIVFFGLAVSTMNLLVDLSYTVLDRRVRYQ